LTQLAPVHFGQGASIPNRIKPLIAQRAIMRCSEFGRGNRPVNVSIGAKLDRGDLWGLMAIELQVAMVAN